MTYVFYAGLLYGEYPDQPYYRRTGGMEQLPDGSYIRYSDNSWYRSDFTPVLLDDVPKELLLMALLLT